MRYNQPRLAGHTYCVGTENELYRRFGRHSEHRDMFGELDSRQWYAVVVLTLLCRFGRPFAYLYTHRRRQHLADCLEILTQAVASWARRSCFPQVFRKFSAYRQHFPRHDGWAAIAPVFSNTQLSHVYDLTRMIVLLFRKFSLDFSLVPHVRFSRFEAATGTGAGGKSPSPIEDSQIISAQLPGWIHRRILK